MARNCTWIKWLTLFILVFFYTTASQIALDDKLLKISVFRGAKNVTEHKIEGYQGIIVSYEVRLPYKSRKVFEHYDKILKLLGFRASHPSSYPAKLSVWHEGYFTTPTKKEKIINFDAFWINKGSHQAAMLSLKYEGENLKKTVKASASTILDHYVIFRYVSIKESADIKKLDLHRYFLRLLPKKADSNDGYMKVKEVASEFSGYYKITANDLTFHYVLSGKEKAKRHIPRYTSMKFMGRTYYVQAKQVLTARDLDGFCIAKNWVLYGNENIDSNIKKKGREKGEFNFTITFKLNKKLKKERGAFVKKMPHFIDFGIIINGKLIAVFPMPDRIDNEIGVFGFKESDLIPLLSGAEKVSDKCQHLTRF